MVMVGAIAMLPLPVTGAVMVNRGPATADALVKIARRDDRVRAALLMILHYSAFAELAMIVAAIAIAINVDMKRIAPDARIAKLVIGQEVADVYGSGAPAPAAQQSNGAPAVPWAAAGGAPSGLERAPGVAG